jgi:hypothetical protein
MGIFDGMSSLGFDEIEGLELYPVEEVKQKEKKTVKPENPMDYLYLKDTECPVCNGHFEAFVIRKSKLRVIETETDLKTTYHTIDPNLYDVMLCTLCGYAALVTYFNHISEKQKEQVQSLVSPRYISKDYPVPLTPENGVERYKLALLCAAVTGMRAGQKAILCLKLAWIYRDLADKTNEQLFIKNALIGLKEAYKSESFPIGAMDETTVKYLIGDLLRRSGQLSEAMRWISEVVTGRNTSRRIKNRALQVKDLIREGSTQ